MMLPTKRDAAAELLRRRAARVSFKAYVAYLRPNYRWSHFSTTVCESIDKFVSDVMDGSRPILVLGAPPQHGKLLAHDTPVLTDKGWRTHGDLRPGDQVCHPDGSFVKVVAVSDEMDCDATVHMSNGSTFVTHSRHEWTVYSRDKKRNVTIETRDFLKLGNKSKRASALVCSGEIGSRGSRYAYQLPTVSPLIGSLVSLPVAPYTLGAWLGDGTRVKPAISGDWKDVSIVDGIIADGYPLRSMWAHSDTGVLTYSFAKLWDDLKAAGVTSRRGDWRPKHIPDCYFSAPLAARLELLAGLIDTDGYVYQKNGRVVFTTAETDLADSVEKLLATFGWRSTRVVEAPKISSSGIEGRKPYYVIGFQPTFEIPCRLPRKRPTRFAQQRAISVAEVVIAPTGKMGRCIQVDRADGLYLVGHAMLPTHNSELISRLLPAYLLGGFPEWRVAAASYSDELAGAMAQDVRRNLVSSAHRRLFAIPLLKDRYDVNRMGEFTAPGGTGGYLGVGVGAGLTGRSATIGLIDDAVKNEKEALSTTVKENHWSWYQATFTTRLAENSGQIIIGTAWADDDLPNRIVSTFNDDPRLTVLRFPAINEPGEVGYNPNLPRGPLVPELKSLKFLQEVKSLFSDYWWAALYQQCPRALGGNVFKESGLRYYFPKDLPAKFDKVIASLDATFKDTDGTDFVVFQVWGKLGANSYLLEQSRARMSFTKTISEVVRIKQDHPRIRQFYVEDKANGPAVIDALKGVISGLIPVEPDGSKLARAHAVTHVWEAGNVWLPHPDWSAHLFRGDGKVKELVGELTAFPAGANDDQVDAMTQALRQLYPLFNRLKITQEALNKAMGR